jgi:hypothetical protein
MALKRRLNTRGVDNMLQILILIAVTGFFLWSANTTPLNMLGAIVVTIAVWAVAIGAMGSNPQRSKLDKAFDRRKDETSTD